MNYELPDVQAGFRKGGGTRDQIANIHWIIEKAREFQKNIYFCFIDYAKAFVWITTNCRKSLKKWEYQTTWPASWEICMQVKKQQLELDMKKWTGSKVGKEYIKAVHCHPAYLTYMQSTSREGNGNPLQYFCLGNLMDGGAWEATVHGVAKSWTWLSKFTFTFHFQALEKEMATHSSILAWRIPGTGAWWAAVYGVTQSQTWLKWLSSSSNRVHHEKCWAG